MSKFFALSCLMFAACATASAGAGTVRADRETAPHAAPRLELTVAADIARVFPVARNPQLPSADRIARKVRDELGEVASADVRLCVAPDGRVQDVQLVRGTRLAEFNRALVRDMADWQFSGSPGSSAAGQLKNCQITTISYRPRG